MKKARILSVALLTMLGMISGWAQEMYDITSMYLKNYGFDTDFDYTIDDTGNVAQEIRQLHHHRRLSDRYTGDLQRSRRARRGTGRHH